MRGKRNLHRYIVRAGDECRLVMAKSAFHAQTVAMLELETPPGHAYEVEAFSADDRQSLYYDMITHFTRSARAKRIDALVASFKTKKP